MQAKHLLAAALVAIMQLTAGEIAPINIIAQVVRKG